LWRPFLGLGLVHLVRLVGGALLRMHRVRIRHLDAVFPSVSAPKLGAG
jgi:hypothetical protein